MHFRLLLTLLLAILFNTVSAQKWSDYDHKWQRYELDSNLAIYLPGPHNPKGEGAIHSERDKIFWWGDKYLIFSASREYINMHDTLAPGLIVDLSLEKQDKYLERRYRVLKKEYGKVDSLHWINGKYHGHNLRYTQPVKLDNGDTIYIMVIERIFIAGNNYYNITSNINLSGDRDVLYEVHNKFVKDVELGDVIHFTVPDKPLIPYRWNDFDHKWIHYKIDSFLTVDLPDTPAVFENRIEYGKDSIRFMVSRMPILTELHNDILRDSMTTDNYRLYHQQLLKEIKKQYPTAEIEKETYKGVYMTTVAYNEIENIENKSVPFKVIDKYFIYNDLLYDVYIRYPLSKKNDVILRILKKYLITITPPK